VSRSYALPASFHRNPAEELSEPQKRITVLIQLTLPFQSDCLESVMNLLNAPASIATISWPVGSDASYTGFTANHAAKNHVAKKAVYMAATFAAVNTKRSPQRLEELLT